MVKGTKVALINNQPPHTGIGRYASSILRRAEENDELTIDHFMIDRDRQALIRNPHDEDEVFFSLDGNPSTRFARYINEDMYLLFLDIALGRMVPGGYDVYHVASQNLSPLVYALDSGVQILTVHDVIYLSNQQEIGKRMLARLLYVGVPQVDEIIAISRWTKRDLLHYFKYSKINVNVIYHGVDGSFEPIDVTENTYERYDLDPRFNYILHVGRPSERKNFSTVLRSAACLASRFEIEDFEILKLNGMMKKNRRLAEELNLLDKIRTFDSVSERELIQLYNIADVFFLPSLYEGFGFPVLEAMACGTPVLTSNRTSIPEVVGDSGVVLEPDDALGYAKQLYHIFTSDAYVQKLRQQGLGRAECFTWERCANRTVSLYQKHI